MNRGNKAFKGCFKDGCKLDHTVLDEWTKAELDEMIMNLEEIYEKAQGRGKGVGTGRGAGNGDVEPLPKPEFPRPGPKLRDPPKPRCTFCKSKNAHWTSDCQSNPEKHEHCYKCECYGHKSLTCKTTDEQFESQLETRIADGKKTGEPLKTRAGRVPNKNWKERTAYKNDAGEDVSYGK